MSGIYLLEIAIIKGLFKYFDALVKADGLMSSKIFNLIKWIHKSEN